MQDGWTSLMSASRLTSTENVEKLLKAGANPNAANDVSFIYIITLCT